jgi:hypothetical protein
MCCADSGLQVDKRYDDNYAFPCLEKQGIEMPTDVSHQLFYILFGETLCKLANDLSVSTKTSRNQAQVLQERSNDLMSKHILHYVQKFLEHITEIFFSGDLHKRLVCQLEVNSKIDIRAKKSEAVSDKHEKWTFKSIEHNLQEALDHIRSTASTGLIKDIVWTQRSVSSTMNKDKILKMFQNASTSSIQGTLDTDKFKSTAVFQPYVQMYNKIKTYFKNGVEHCAQQRNQHTEEEIKYFYENRMLTMRICEEQMHLIQRHQMYIKDFPESQAWDLLFDMFMYQRQLFAELKVQGLPNVLGSTERSTKLGHKYAPLNTLGFGQRSTKNVAKYVPPHRR